WLDACAAVRAHGRAEDAAALVGAIRDGGLRAAELVQEVLAGRPEGVHARAELLHLDGSLIATTLRLALFPVMANWSTALAPLRQGTRWEQGFCPTCGSWPLLGEFRGLEQIRYLRCGLCASGWEFPRLLCPFCGER